MRLYKPVSIYIVEGPRARYPAFPPLVAGIGSKIVNAEVLEKALVLLRCQLAALLSADGVVPDTEPVVRECCTTPIRAGLLQAWSALARDPGLPVCGW